MRYIIHHIICFLHHRHRIVHVMNYRKPAFLIYILLNLLSILALFQCQSDKNISFEVVISPEYEIKVPVGPNTFLNRVRLFNYRDSIVYLGANETIYFYDLKDKELSIDTFLRSHDYVLYDKLPMGIFGDKLVFDGIKSMAFYDILTREIESWSKSGDKQNSILDQVRLSTGVAFGLSNRIYKTYLPMVSWKKRENVVFYLFDGEHTQSFPLDIPTELLKLIYDCNPNLIHPYIEQDHLNGGFTIVLPLSCRIFHFNENHETTEVKVKSPEFDCEISPQNFVKATARNFFPETLPIYGNVISDQYRKLYYQFYSAPIIPGMDQRVSYLRVLDSQFNYLSSIEIDWNDFSGQLLILEDGAFIQSASPPDEKYFYYQKIEVIPK